MANNYEANAGSGGKTFASIQISNVDYPSIFCYGSDDSGSTARLMKTDSNGELYVIDTELEAAIYADDDDWTDGTSKHVLTGGLYQSSPQTITDGDVGPLQVTSNGFLIVSVNDMPSDTFVAEDGALGKGVLIQGDDGTDRHNVAVDTSGYVRVNVSETVAVIGTATDSSAYSDKLLVIGGVDTNANYWKVASSGAGLVDVNTMPNDTFVAEDGALGKGVLLQGDDGTDRHNVAVDTSGLLQIDLVADSAGGVEVVQDTAADLNVTEASASDIKTAVELIDDTVYVDDADWTDGASKHLLIGGLYQSSPQTITDGDVGPLEVTSNGYLIVSVNGTVTADVTGQGDVPVTLDGESVTLGASDGTDIGDVDVASVVPGTGATNLGKAEDASHTGGDTGVFVLAVRNDTLATLAGTDGDYAPFQVNASGALYVAATDTAGDVAHDGADSGNPVKVGAYAGNAMPTAVANADRVNVLADLYGRLINCPWAPQEKWQSYTSGGSPIADTNDDVVFAAAGASVKHYITHFSAMNGDGSTDTRVDLKDEDDTVLASIWAENSGGGAALTFNPPIAVTANKAVEVACSAAASVTVNINGYQGP